MTRPDDHVIVLFGATGDLAKRKLLPGLFHLARAGLLPDGYRIVGSAPAQYALNDDAFRKHTHDANRRLRTVRAAAACAPTSPGPRTPRPPASA